MNILSSKFSGIYKIENTINGYCYIGSAVNLNLRRNRHQYELNSGRHYNLHLQRAWKKYGSDNFIFSILEYCDVSLLLEREQYYFNTLLPEYNIAKYSDAPMKGKILPEAQKMIHRAFRHSEEAKEKISKANKGRVKSDEERQNISDGRKGIPNSNKGKPLTEIWKKRIGDAQRGKKRKPHAEETRAKMSEKRKTWWEKIKAIGGDKSSRDKKGRFTKEQ